MYYEGSYFWQLFHDTQVYTRRATAIYCGSPARRALNQPFLLHHARTSKPGTACHVPECMRTACHLPVYTGARVDGKQYQFLDRVLLICKIPTLIPSDTKIPSIRSWFSQARAPVRAFTISTKKIPKLFRKHPTPPPPKDDHQI